ncbi:hypothetical protein EVAR_40959_1 [Eumeta japonica]|uniref:Uncharacterized protein n=1 Tax=Eumeta variegata TaxID=151549 RepID=A0A4C1X7Q7_EUMVA|nr:hypothetical protein EVAR_40959_1 [Eumeta japonica]
MHKFIAGFVVELRIIKALERFSIETEARAPAPRRGRRGAGRWARFRALVSAAPDNVCPAGRQRRPGSALLVRSRTDLGARSSRILFGLVLIFPIVSQHDRTIGRGSRVRSFVCRLVRSSQRKLSK